MLKHNEFHKPVLLKEVIEILNVSKGQKIIDATFGFGGHSLKILACQGEVLGIDVDKNTAELFKARLELEGRKFKVFKKNKYHKFLIEKFAPLHLYISNFTELSRIAKKIAFTNVDGIIFDLGLSTYQLEKAKKGLSFSKHEILDMRLDPSLKKTAADILNQEEKEVLYEIFTKFGEEQRAWSIASAIVFARAIRPIQYCDQLFNLIQTVVNPKKKKRLTNLEVKSAARTFQALRIIVNNELENLKIGLDKAFSLLKREGKLVVISFHSLEDRIVKKFYLEKQREQTAYLFNKKPIRPTFWEIKHNPRSRSAKLRALVHLG